MSLKEDIINLRNDGKSFSEIQSILGCSKGTISYHLKSVEPIVKDKPMTKSEPAILSKFQLKALTYLENYKLQRPCVKCSQYLHSSQLDPVDNIDVDKIINNVIDAETLQDSKQRLSQLKFICANCDRLRQFKANN